MTLWNIYPFLEKFLKFGFAQPGAEKFFSDLMKSSMKQREESDIKQIDYLDHLITLKNRKEISGEWEIYMKILKLKFNLRLGHCWSWCLIFSWYVHVHLSKNVYQNLNFQMDLIPPVEL